MTLKLVCWSAWMGHNS